MELVIGNTRSIVQRILGRELDLGMVGEHPEEHAHELEILGYASDDIVLVASPNHPLSQLHSVTPEQVMAQGLIARELGSATRDAAEKHFASLGVSPQVVLELGSNQAVKQAAGAGGGIGVISKLGVAAETKAGMLTVLDVAGWHCRRPLTVIYLKHRHLSPAQQAFLQFLEVERPVPSVD